MGSFKKTLMDSAKKNGRYQRLYDQIKELVDNGSNNSLSTMSTIIAVLHNKMDYYYWTGFYFLVDNKLQVGPYQGSLACIDLKKDTGACWGCINQGMPLIVPNVNDYPGHIACDSKSASEIVIPLKTSNGKIIGVMDVDSVELNSFDEVDAIWLEKIIALIKL